jgi:hypothetical protein
VRTQFVTGTSPAGVYYYRGFAVAGTDTSMDSFMFVKERDENHGAAFYSGLSGVEGWVNSGEDFSTQITSVGVNNNLVNAFVLHGASPNPFNSTTVIRFSLPQAARVKLEVFDTAGRNVSSVSTYGSDLDLQPGMHEISIDGSRLTSGVYLYRLTTGGSIATNKLVLVK